MHLLGYHLSIALRGLRRQPWITAQMILAIAFGVGVYCSTASALSSVSNTPLGQSSEHLYHPQVDATSKLATDTSADPPDDLTLRDARAIFAAAPVGARVMTSRNWLPLVLDASGHSVARMAITRAATAEFFGIFKATFLYGRGWTATEDQSKQQVVVLSRKMNQHLFGDANSVGRSLQIATRTFTVIGVLNDWDIVPRFYDLNDGAYADPEEIFVPFDTWLDLPQDYGYGPMRCSPEGANDRDHNPSSEFCTWVQVWTVLTAEQRDRYTQFLINYSKDQLSLGRFTRTPNVRLMNVPQWIAYKHAIPDVVRIQHWVSLALLLICVISTAGLQVVKFRARFSEFGIRRALGASKGTIFRQLLAEGFVTGTLGGALGILFGVAGVYILRHSSGNYANYVGMSIRVAAMSLAISILVTLLATALPAMRATRVPPYQQMAEE